jgi:transcriptional regulator with XRE-family HTH domain
LREWRRSKGWNQGEIAAKLRIAQNTYSAWETGRSEIPADGERDLRKLGFAGQLPRQDAAASAPAPYVTREELAELRGALKAHVEYWRTGEGKVLQRLEELAQRIEAIERRVNS